MAFYTLMQRSVHAVVLGLAFTLGCKRTPESDKARASGVELIKPVVEAQSAAPALAPPPPLAPVGCARIPFLNVYKQAGALKKYDGKAIVLDVRIDVHGLDCGAPDCWGHEMDLVLQVEAKQDRCEIVSATSSAQPFNECGAPMDDRTVPWTNTFTVVGSPNLAERDLERIELRDLSSGEALVLLPYDYYFYNGVSADTPLKQELQGEEPAKGFRYGYTQSRTAHWKFEYWLSPLALANLSSSAGTDLNEFNRWATAAELRESLTDLARRGLDLSKQARIQTAFDGREPATGATVTVEDAIANHDAIKARKVVMQFSRKVCPTCTSEMSGWWLWRLDVTHACKPGHGHQAFSNEPCNE